MSRTISALTTAGGLPNLGSAPTAISSACSSVQRIQSVFEALGGASNWLLLFGVGAGVLASYLAGLVSDSALEHAKVEMSNSILGMENR